MTNITSTETPERVSRAVDDLFAEIEAKVAAGTAPANGYRMGARLFSAVRDRLQESTAEDLSELSAAQPLVYQGVRMLYSTRWAGELLWVPIP